MAAGKKHHLIIYSRTMDRLWLIAILFGLEMFALWKYGAIVTPFYRAELAPLLFAAAIYAAGLGVFAFLARGMGYVRAYDGYFLIASPFFRFKTSYRRVRGVRAVDFHRLFKFKTLSWAEERYTETMIGNSAVVVNLTAFPVPPRLIGIFFHPYLFSPNDAGLVLLVPDWMALSVELDSRYNEFRQRKSAYKKSGGFQRGGIF